MFVLEKTANQNTVLNKYFDLIGQIWSTYTKITSLSSGFCEMNACCSSLICFMFVVLFLVSESSIYLQVLKNKTVLLCWF